MTDPNQIPIQELRQRCQEQRKIYKRSSGTIQGKDCDEIVRRACQHDQEAWNILFEISWEIAVQRCPYLEEKEDLAQDVVLRLFRRAQKMDDPLKFLNFAQYHRYLNVIIKHVSIKAGEVRKKNAQVDSLDEFDENGKKEPFEWKDPDDPIEQKRLFSLCLSTLPNLLEREVFIRRYHRGETIAEIVKALKSVRPDIDEDQVYDLAANAIRRVRKIIHNRVNKSEDKS